MRDEVDAVFQGKVFELIGLQVLIAAGGACGAGPCGLESWTAYPGFLYTAMAA
jgi:hypothetical protein